MPGEQRRLIADLAGIDNITDEGRKRVDGSGDIVESAWPAATALPSAPELRYAHHEARGRECRRERAGVRPVKGHPPEPAMQEDHQLCGARNRRQRNRRQRTSRQRTSRQRTGRARRQAHVRHVLGLGAIGEHHVWRWRRPGQYVRRQRASKGVVEAITTRSRWQLSVTWPARSRSSPRCTSPGHPLFLDMNVYFHHRAGKLVGGAQGVDRCVELQWLGMLSAFDMRARQLRMSR